MNLTSFLKSEYSEGFRSEVSLVLKKHIQRKVGKNTSYKNLCLNRYYKEISEYGVVGTALIMP